jgi:hypothetical protein
MYGVGNDGEIDIHLVIGVAFVMKFFGDVSDENRLCFELCQKGIDDPVIDARKLATNFRPIQYIPNFANNRLAHKERYVSIENSRNALRAGLFRLAIP